MKTNEMRQLTSEELAARVGEWQEDLYRARCNKVIGQLTDTTRLRVLRRQIARAKTLIHEMMRDAAKQD
jgi:large subunit ribosomal protein L29